MKIFLCFLAFLFFVSCQTDAEHLNKLKGPIDDPNGDADGDLVLNVADNCPLAANDNQADLDGDGLGDLCDEDDDNDGSPDLSDLFPQDAADFRDSDADGFGDSRDNCPLTANEAQRNLDNDGLGDLCDPDADGDGHCAMGVLPEQCPNGGLSDDCGDLNAATLPGNPEVLDGEDNNCNGSADEGIRMNAASLTIDFGGESIVAASIGDFNGDGRSDFAVGSAMANRATGKLYVFYGKPEWPAPVLPAQADVVFNGPVGGSRAGESFGNTGDVNRDGCSDLVVTAPGIAGQGQGASRGKVYVVYGQGPACSGVPLQGEIDLENVGGIIAGMNFLSPQPVGYFLGSDAGDAQRVPLVNRDQFIGGNDLNHDGCSDVVLSGGTVERSDVFVAYGHGSGCVNEQVRSGAQNLNDADVIRLSMPQGQTGFGRRIVASPDVNGDGMSDLWISAPSYRIAGNNEGPVGKIYLFLGGAMHSIPDVNQESSASFIAEQGGSFAGAALASVGDVNGDGLGDMAISSLNYDPPGVPPTRRGKIYVFLGRNDFNGEINLVNANLSLVGEAGFVEAGAFIASSGDVNNDGLNDFSVTSRRMLNANDLRAGRTYFILGSVTEFNRGNSVILGDQAGSLSHATFTDENVDAYRAFAIQSSGDVNGDGKPDLMISLTATTNSRQFPNKVSIFFGR
ncbi:MAG TPA: hypothetical protein DDW49_03310 [Deltaproteobacteria bacterium]|nr:MAG: hypothetical protein A2048_08630 [Deltaproteobacteria bacterium GWA2_45_12]HBF12409.1 hypothetical protein [Deltaproteobacteria bacterium]